MNPRTCDPYQLMHHALEEAKAGLLEGEVPVGAVLATLEGEIVATSHNRPIALNDPSAHAEILVMRKAGIAFQNYRLTNTILVVTIEPCLMCMAAAVHARISRLVFGAADSKTGAAGSVYNLAADERLNHRIDIVSGILEERCSALLQDFFKARRGTTQSSVERGEVPKWS